MITNFLNYLQGPQYGITNFDNIGQAMLTVFQVRNFLIYNIYYIIWYIYYKKYTS